MNGPRHDALPGAGGPGRSGSRLGRPREVPGVCVDRARDWTRRSVLADTGIAARVADNTTAVIVR